MDFEELPNLLGAYYHEDFVGIWPTFDAYVQDANSEELARLVTEIDAFLSETPPQDVPRRTRELGSYLWLGDTPGPYIEWIQDVRRRAAAALALS